MNTPFQFDHDKRQSFQFERSDFRTHYDDVAARTLVSIGRHRRFIASLVVLALALACMILPLLPRKYSAEALIYPKLFSHEQGRAVAVASVDAASIVNGEARLIRSDAVLRAVVKRLGMDHGAAGSPSWASQSLDWVRAMFLPETRNLSPFDRAVATLRDKVAVMNDTRAYFISISFTAPTADEAVRVVNAFALQHLQDQALQQRRDAVSAAEGELWRQLAVYGDKHPKVVQAAAGLETARATLSAAMNSEDGGPDLAAPDESVKLAIPNRTPTSPRGFVILGLSFILALVAGIGLAIWRDHRDFKRKATVSHQPHAR
jgi:uncharacterized protein involved in exopolysaccharide biosynthesis